MTLTIRFASTPSLSTRALARAAFGVSQLSTATIIQPVCQRQLSQSLSKQTCFKPLLRPKLHRVYALSVFGCRGFANAKNEDEKRPSKTPLRKRLLSPTIHENIWNVPNILTFSRLAAAPAVGYLILNDQPFYALGLFVYAGVTDLVDGYIARKYNLQTVVGTVIDPMADKALMTIATVCLAVQGSMPLFLAVIILGRDIGLAISAIYYRYISLPPPKTFARYWDFSLPSAEVHPTGISKANTFFQLGLVSWIMAMPAMQAWGWAGAGVETTLVGMQYFVAATTVWSGTSYIYSKDAVKILSQEEAIEKEMEQKGKKQAEKEQK